MMNTLCRASFVALLTFATPLPAADPPPKSLDPRIKIELFAEDPLIATPTGIDVDHAGRVWVIESNTHFPPEGYNRHPTDRVHVLIDKDGDGKADDDVIFTDGLKFTMSVAVKPPWFGASRESRVESRENKNPSTVHRPPSTTSTSVYLATRAEIFLFHDDDGDLKADRKESIVRLETKGNYPHNGLAGIAFDPIGWMFFGFGENLGEPYKIIGSDGTTLSGGGEGGNVYRCRLDGSKLERWATGFWNPHASCFDAFGRLFTVDNDADSRPPCRLLHIIPGGDYGFRFRNGRKGLHPFTAWNGEIPGTLPMVAGTGEAPSGILAYESDGLPDEYLGNLLVTSWGDHRIDRFRLKPKGASFESLAEPLIVGGENFRPVGIACAPDGSLFVSDWVLRDYKLHGKGRVWRISTTARERASPDHEMSFAELDREDVLKLPREPLKVMLADRRSWLRRSTANSLATFQTGREFLMRRLRDAKSDPRVRMEAFAALMNVPPGPPDAPEGKSLLRAVLKGQRMDEASVFATWSASLPPLSLTYSEFHAVLRDEGEAVFVTDDQTTPNVMEWAESARFRFVFAMNLLALASTNPNTVPFMQVRREVEGVTDPDFIFLGSRLFARESSSENLASSLQKAKNSAFTRLCILLGSKARNPPASELVPSFLADSDKNVRRAAVQWAAEEGLKEFRPQVAAILNDPGITSDLFLATLAALEMLDGVPPQEFDKTPASKYVVPLLKDANRPPAVRVQALRLASPADPALDETLLESLLASPDEPLRRETVRTLQASPVEQASRLLLSILNSKSAPVPLKADALVSLSAHARSPKPNADIFAALRSAALSLDATLRREGLRALRGLGADDADTRKTLKSLADTLALVKQPLPEHGELAEQLAMTLGDGAASLPKEVLALRPKRPATMDDWKTELNENRRAGGVSPPVDAPATNDRGVDTPRSPVAGAEADAGRRTFFHPNSAGCFKCHTVNGRGGNVGPDLSTIGRSMSREKLIESILEPSREVAPQFTTWTMETTAGKVLSGMLVHENEGKTILGDAEGKLTELKTIDIVGRTPQRQSVMPDKLADRLTVQEFRDLLAFLESLK